MTHARNMILDQRRSEGLCGLIKSESVWPEGTDVVTTFTSKDDDVTCDHCLKHELWEVWVLKHTKV